MESTSSPSSGKKGPKACLGVGLLRNAAKLVWLNRPLMINPKNPALPVKIVRRDT
jgi:hypothetical protein